MSASLLITSIVTVPFALMLADVPLLSDDAATVMS